MYRVKLPTLLQQLWEAHRLQGALQSVTQRNELTSPHRETLGGNSSQQVKPDTHTAATKLEQRYTHLRRCRRDSNSSISLAEFPRFASGSHVSSNAEYPFQRTRYSTPLFVFRLCMIR